MFQQSPLDRDRIDLDHLKLWNKLVSEIFVKFKVSVHRSQFYSFVISECILRYWIAISEITCLFLRPSDTSIFLFENIEAENRRVWEICL